MSDGLKRLPTSRGIQIRIKYASHSDTQYRFPELREERTNSPLFSQLGDDLELRTAWVALCGLKGCSEP